MLFYFAIAVVVSGLAAFEDWRRGEISNTLTLGTLAAFPVIHGARAIQLGGDLGGAALSSGMSILGALACGVGPYVLFVKGGARGGDVKLCAALGAILKPVIGIEAVFYGFLVAALVAPARLAYEGKLYRTIKTSFFLMLNPVLPRSRRIAVSPESMTWIRMGPAFLMGVLITVVLHLPELVP